MNPLFRILLLPLLIAWAFASRAAAQDEFHDALKQVEPWRRQYELAYQKGQYAQGLSICLRVIDALEPLLPEHPTFATALNDCAELYRAQGNHTKAEPLFLRSLEIREKTLGLEHSDVAETLNNLAVLYREQGNYDKAEHLYLRSHRIWEKALGSEHPNVATSLNNLAALYSMQGQSEKSELMYQRSLRIREKTLGPEHPHVALALNNLGHTYYAQGNYAKAEPLFLRALRIMEKALGSEHPHVATCLGNLGSLYQAQGNYAKAEPLFLQALRLEEKGLGPWHPSVALSLNNLATMNYEQGKYQKAETLFLRSLKLNEQVLGPDHPSVALSLNNLGWIYASQGSYANAEPLLLRSLRIYEKALGPEHPIVATSLYGLTRLELGRGQPALAMLYFDRALGIDERTLHAAATEARISLLLDEMRGQEDAIYSLLLRKDAPHEARALVLRTILLRKMRTSEVGLITSWALQASLTNPEQRQRFADWQAVRSQYEALFLRGPAKLDNETRQTHQAQLAALTNQIDDLEHELTRAAPQMAQWKLPEPEQIVAQVASRLPNGSALVEILWVNPYQFQAIRRQDRWSPPRYVALILFPDQRIEFVDLGDAEQMDRAAGELLVAVRDLSQEPLRLAQALYQKVMVPLLSKIGGAQQIFLSLDGSLNLVPFAALHDGQQYLIDAPYQVLYLSSGRDLLREEMAHPKQPALVLADPDFGSKRAGPSPDGQRRADADARSLYEGLVDLPQLPGARAEGALVGALLQVSPLLGAAATEARLRQVRSPWLLHIATHGLFLDSTRAGSHDARATLVGVRPNDTFELMTGRTVDRSLSRSALVLAGATHAATATDSSNDGLLTAEEARSLNLFGTQLVVLSACDTGRGAVKAGQGVYGLRRAFLAAGAETVVMSLWSVSDLGTQGLMQRYYRLLLDRKKPRSRISGLLEAMRAVKAERAHPYYWAPFIANGLDTPLSSGLRGIGPR